MKTKNAGRQAIRGSLKVVSGVNTSVAVINFFGGLSMPKGEKLITRDAMLRMYERKPQTFDEKAMLVLLAATKTGELKKGYRRMWTFRGLEFYTLRGDVPLGIFERLTDEEKNRDNIPMPD